MFFKALHVIAALAVASSVTAQDPLPSLPSSISVCTTTGTAAPDLPGISEITSIIEGIAPDSSVSVVAACPTGEECTSLTDVLGSTGLSSVLGALPGLGDIPGLDSVGVRTLHFARNE